MEHQRPWVSVLQPEILRDYIGYSMDETPPPCPNSIRWALGGIDAGGHQYLNPIYNWQIHLNNESPSLEFLVVSFHQCSVKSCKLYCQFYWHSHLSNESPSLEFLVDIFHQRSVKSCKLYC